jgi:hypothetical protein
VTRLGPSTGEVKVNIASEDISNNALSSNVNPYNLPIDALLSARGLISPVGENPSKFSLRINSTDGTYSGSFEAAEEIVPPATKAVVRKVAFSGAMLQLADAFQDDIIGGGFFIAPPLAPATIGISGLMQIIAGPADSPFIIKNP